MQTSYTPSVLSESDLVERFAAVQEFVKEERLRRKWGQKTLSQKSGVDQPVISRIENGESVPDLKTLYRLIDGFEFTPQEFFANLESQPKSDLHTTDVVVNTPPSQKIPRAGDHGDSVSRAADAYTLEILLGGIAQQLGATIGEPIAAALDRLALRDQSVSKTRRPTSHDRKDRHKRTG